MIKMNAIQFITFFFSNKDDELLDKDDVGLTVHAEKNAASSTLSLGESISMAHLVDNIKQGTTDNYDNTKEKKYVNRKI